MRPWVIGLVLAGALCPRPAAAQPPPIFFAPESHTGLLTRFMAYTSVEALAEPGDEFEWDADLGLSVDFLDFGRGRLNVLFNYEAVLGSELQPFDPRQGNYTIDTLGTLRRGDTEWGLLFRHVSRHLGDRVKGFGIAWNDLGLQVVQARQQGRWLWEARGRALATVMHGFVDYRGDLGGELKVRRSMSPRMSLISSAGGHARFVRPSRFERGTQGGGRLEIGFRVAGEAGAFEVVAGVERRVDADALELAPREWAFAGVRVLGPK
jgi:hypothetical protein